MKHLLALLLFTTPVSAAVYNISVTGTLTDQHSDLNNSCACVPTDANLSVGSKVVLTASFDASLLIPWGDFGYSVVGLYGLPSTGNAFFRIDAPGMTWQSSDSLLDGAPVYRQYDNDVPTMFEGSPALIIQGEKVIGLFGYLSPSSSDRPEINLGSTVGALTDYRVDGVDNFLNLGPAILSNSFSIDTMNGRYGNFYNSQGFSGVWDFANSSAIDPPSASEVASVPEPSTWAMFIIGFALVGWRKRHELHLSRV